MTTLGALSVGLLVVVLLVVGGIALMARSQRRRPSRGLEQPRTVADLVRMREAAAAEASVEAQVDVAPVNVAPVNVAPVVAAPVDVAPVVVAAPEVADKPVADAPRPKSGSAQDTPWARAARMADPLGEWTASARAARDRETPTGTHAPERRVKLFGAIAEPDVAAQAAAAAAKETAAKPEVAAHLVDEPTVELDGIASPPVAAASEEPTIEIVAVSPPLPIAGTGSAGPEEPTVELNRSAALPPAPTPRPEPPGGAEPSGPVASADLSGSPCFGRYPTPARIAGRVRRSPADTAAEHAAVDLALLRTFGVAGPGRTAVVDDTEVALEGCMSDADEPGAGSAQPVAFRVVGRDGKGVAGASVTLLDDHGRETGGTLVDDTGAGMLTARRPGGYMLVTAADGFQPGAITIAVTDGPVDAEIPLTRSATIAGTVSSDDGPVVGARLVLVQDGEIVDTALSAEDGAYRFADVAAGEYGVSVTAPECEPSAAVLRIGDEADLCHDVDLDPAGPSADRDATGDVMIGHL
jgi:hypothetical protein